MIRLDDFPDGRRGHPTDREALAKVLDMFQAAGLAFILGVSPLLLAAADLEWLDRRVRAPGAVVMHGFDHGFGWSGEWANVRSTWAAGGEFAGLSAAEFLDRWTRCDALLRQVGSYDPRHFIPPFNAYTQAALDALQQAPVEHLYSLDCLHSELRQDRLDHGRLALHLSKWQQTYGRVDVVVANYRPASPVIALHWAFDADLPGWEAHYRELARLVSVEAA